MKSILLLCALFAFAPISFAQGPVTRQYAVSALPAASVQSGLAVTVTDGATATDCTTGGGTNIVLCRSNGSTWTQPTVTISNPYTLTSTGDTSFTAATSGTGAFSSSFLLNTPSNTWNIQTWAAGNSGSLPGSLGLKNGSTYTLYVDTSSNFYMGGTAMSGGAVATPYLSLTGTAATFSKPINGILAGANNPTDTASLAIPITQRQAYVALTANTAFTLASGTDGQEITLIFGQPGTVWTITAPANVHGFMSTAGMTANHYNAQHFVYVSAISAWIADSVGVVNE